MNRIFLFAAALLGLAACTKTGIDTPASSFSKGQVVTISASSDLNVTTKVTGTDDGTNINFRWEEGDKVLVKVGGSSAEFTLKTGAGTSNATFEGTMPASGSTFDMQYPVGTPDLSSQDYVSDNQIPKGKMLFTATGCTLSSAADLQPQYALLQINLNGIYFTSDNYVKKITVTVNDSDPVKSYSLNVPASTVVLPHSGATTFATFYLVVDPGTYGFKVSTDLYDPLISTNKISTTSDKTFIKGECLNLDGANVSSCLAAGTRITMADGSFKNVEDIVEGDIVRTFDHEAGCISSQKICLTYKGETKNIPLILSFASGRTLSIIGTHDLLFKDTLKYVRINGSNIKSYIGKQFYNAETGSWDVLTYYEMGAEPVEYYCLYSAYHLNCIAEGMLTCPDDVDFYLNIYELDGNLKADPDRLAADIQQYGLWNFYEKYQEYAEFAELWEELQFKYINIALGKGLVTRAQLHELLNYWDGANLVSSPKKQ